MESNNAEPKSLADIETMSKALNIVDRSCGEFKYSEKKFDSMESVQTKASTASDETEITSLCLWEAKDTQEEHIKAPCWLNTLENSHRSVYVVQLSSGKDGDEKPPKYYEEFCRICHSGNEEEALISPCNCSGSTKYAHQSCLLSWFELKKDKICELCLYEVTVKQTGFKPFAQWKLPWRSCDLVSYLFMLYCLVLVVFIAMVLWIASKRCLSPICVVLYFACGLAISYFTYCCGCMEHMRDYWKTWIQMNRQWLILSRKDIGQSSGDEVFRSKNTSKTCKVFEEVV